MRSPPCDADRRSADADAPSTSVPEPSLHQRSRSTNGLLTPVSSGCMQPSAAFAGDGNLCYQWIPKLNGIAMFSVLRRRRRTPEISVGARYCRRDAPNIVWEVYSLFTGIDGMPYAGIFFVSDPTRRKTVSRAVLEHDGQYARVIED